MQFVDFLMDFVLFVVARLVEVVGEQDCLQNLGALFFDDSDFTFD